MPLPLVVHNIKAVGFCLFVCVLLLLFVCLFVCF